MGFGAVVTLLLIEIEVIRENFGLQEAHVLLVEIEVIGENFGLQEVHVLPTDGSCFEENFVGLEVAF